MNVEKLPIVFPGINLDKKLAIKVKIITVNIITSPFLISRFLFFPYS